MYDAGKVIVGLGIFVVLFTSPFWYNAAIGTDLGAPDPAPALKMSPRCVQETRWMRERHMDLLNTWRNDVVRLDDRFLIQTDAYGRLTTEIRKWPDGAPMQKSLSNTCLRCHSNYTEFCQRCHRNSAVTPLCFDCHLTRTEGVKP
jgi:hypothetical protein